MNLTPANTSLYHCRTPEFMGGTILLRHSPQGVGTVEDEEGTVFLDLGCLTPAEFRRFDLGFGMAANHPHPVRLPEMEERLPGRFVARLYREDEVYEDAPANEMYVGDATDYAAFLRGFTCALAHFERPADAVPER